MLRPYETDTIPLAHAVFSDTGQAFGGWSELAGRQ